MSIASGIAQVGASQAAGLGGESVTYTPYGGAGAVVNAVVTRPVRGMVGGSYQTRTSSSGEMVRFEYEREVTISQADLASVNEGGDQVALLKNLGDAAVTTYIVARIISQDGGQWRLGLKG